MTRTAKLSPSFAIVVAGVALIAMPAIARAAIFNVDRTDDVLAATGCDDATPDDCSLRGAVVRANADGAHDEIVIPAGTHTLNAPAPCTFLAAQTADFPRAESFFGSTPALCLNGDVDIVGAGADSTIIESSGADRIFAISVGRTLAIRAVTLTGGVAGFGYAIGGGGAILNHGTLTVTGCVLAENYAGTFGGAAIFNLDTVTVVGTRLTANSTSGPGGGIANWGTLHIADSTLNDNVADWGGGLANDGLAAVTGCTISGNTADNSGGGLSNSGTATLTVVNSTISGNRGGYAGGGIANGGSSPSFASTVHLTSVTITGNDSRNGGGIANAGEQTFTLRNTILAGNTMSERDPDCQSYEPLTSEGHNLVAAACRIAGDSTGNRTGQDAMLAPLVENGGPSATHALRPGSPAIDAGDPAGCTDPEGNLLSTDQRGSPRSADGDGDGTARCDIGAFELSRTFAILGIRPSAAGNAGPIVAVVYGAGFESGATVVLRRAGEPDVVGSPVTVGTSGSVIATSFDLTRRPLGAWDVLVTNPGGGSVSRTAAFVIEETREAELWTEIVGPLRIRRGVPSFFKVHYGNRGNVDAFAVPLVIGVPKALVLGLRFDVLPPPAQPGDPPIDWSRVHTVLTSSELPDQNIVPLLLPYVPAGFTGSLIFTVTPPRTLASDPLLLVPAIGSPWLQSGLDPTIAREIVDGVVSYVRRVRKFGISSSYESLLMQSLAARLQLAMTAGVAAHTASLGTTQSAYSVPQLVVALGGSAVSGGGGEDCGNGVDDDGDGLTDAADPDCQGDDGDGEDDGDDDEDEDDEECEPVEPENPWYADDDCDGEPDCKEGGFDTCAPPPCEKWPPTACGGPPPGPRPVGPYDPNDKVGSRGAGAAGFLSGEEPLRYTISFENVATASAPALGVVITDQLDATKLDLSTLSLGAITFGDDTTVVPPPGLSTLTTDVDLRPANDLIVRIAASLDPATNILTWSLRSIDPETGEPPTDADAGFLPPNVNPPEGEGSVSFTVDSLPGLPTGSEIRNRASIVFDLNDPILTPEWLNTIDIDMPSSQVTSAAAGACSQAIAVAWSGTDAGSGIQSYDVFVSEDGGPFKVWQQDTEAVGGTFTGKWGRSYAFYSIARDATGNLEEAPVAPDATAAVADCGPFDLAVTKIMAPKALTLSARNPALETIVKVQIQNRSAQPQTIPTLGVLRRLVRLEVQSLGGVCADPGIVLLPGRPQKERPIVLKSKKKVAVAFRVTFACANDPAKTSTKSPGHEDYSLLATIDQTVLGGADAYPADDPCPRQVAPPGVAVPYPDGSTVDKGCGAKRPDKTFGDPVLVDMVDKR